MRYHEYAVEKKRDGRYNLYLVSTLTGYKKDLVAEDLSKRSALFLCHKYNNLMNEWLELNK